MLRTFIAQEFIEPARRGINRPIRIRGFGEDGEFASIFLKTRAGYGNRPSAPGVELFTTLLARELGLLAPEPVLVDVPARFFEQVFDFPSHRALLEQSPGLNFGTISLGPDWKTWPVGMSVSGFSAGAIEAILIFDAIVQHTDRIWENPNLMWCGHEIAVIDHEKCFGYLGLVTDIAHPWREIFTRSGLRTHCLIDSGKRLLRKEFGDEMWANLVGLENEKRLSELVRAATEAFPLAALEIDLISAYLETLFRDIGDLLEFLKYEIDR